MLDRNTFMETLRSVAELTRTSAEPLSREEILKYFEGMTLTENQVEMIYQYLQLSPEEQTAEPMPEEEEEEVQIVEEAEEENSYFQMYLDDLAQIEEMSEEEMQEAYEKLLAGDISVIGRISESWLPTISELAIPYAEKGANLEDVIQEGSMGLLIKLSELAGIGEMPGVDAVLEGAVHATMIDYVEGMEETQAADLFVKDKR